MTDRGLERTDRRLDRDVAVRSSRRASVARREFSPAQAFSGLIGIAMVVVGGVVSARVGITPLFGETAPILGVEMTSFTGLAQMVIGLIFIASAASPGSARRSLMGIGAGLIAAGSILFIEPTPFNEALGEVREIGVGYGTVGLLALITGIASRTRSTRSYETVVDEPL